MDCSPPGSSLHGIFQERVLEWIAISFSRGSSWPRDRTLVSCIAGWCFTGWATRESPKEQWKWKWKWSRFWLFATPWAVAYQAPPSVEFSRQKYWSGLLFPSPGDLPYPGIKPRSSALQAEDAFELRCWRRLLRVPWTAIRPNQFLKEINPEYLLEVLTVKLKFKYFGHLIWRPAHWKRPWCWGKSEGNRRSGWQRMWWLDSITDSMDINLSKLGR